MSFLTEVVGVFGKSRCATIITPVFLVCPCTSLGKQRLKPQSSMSEMFLIASLLIDLWLLDDSSLNQLQANQYFHQLIGNVIRSHWGQLFRAYWNE